MRKVNFHGKIGKPSENDRFFMACINLQGLSAHIAHHRYPALHLQDWTGYKGGFLKAFYNMLEQARKT